MRICENRLKRIPLTTSVPPPPQAPKASAARARTTAAVAGGYRKGGEALERILEAALQVFGSAGFKGATTRWIVEEAGAKMPALQYYFGGEEGLYRACAEEVAARYRALADRSASDAALALQGEIDPEQARVHLKAVVGALTGLLVGAKESQVWTSFVLRELADPGPAFEILFDRLWDPGVELIAALIGRIEGRPAPIPETRVHAVMLISSLTAFQTGRNAALRTLHWRGIGAEELAIVRAVLDTQIGAIGAA
jgi:AcrR family transcriptional regulator